MGGFDVTTRRFRRRLSVLRKKLFRESDQRRLTWNLLAVGDVARSFVENARLTKRAACVHLRTRWPTPLWCFYGTVERVNYSKRFDLLRIVDTVCDIRHHHWMAAIFQQFVLNQGFSPHLFILHRDFFSILRARSWLFFFFKTLLIQ